jgi:hypothetical protein
MGMLAIIRLTIGTLLDYKEEGKGGRLQEIGDGETPVQLTPAKVFGSVDARLKFREEAF